MKNPEVSVIIPAYNAEKYIEKCLMSLKNQSFKDFEIIVVDDCSNDNTFEIAKAHTVVIKTPEHSGAGIARNLGIKYSKGKILAFTDADVVLPPNWLNNIAKDMLKNDVKCVAGGYCGGISNSFIENFAYHELVYRRKDLPEFVDTAVSNNFACQKDVFFEVNGFPENYLAASLEDMVLSYKISKKYKIYWDKENGVYHHFKNTLKEYLKQQYVFGRDTTIAYFDYPGLFFIRTHQGKGLYIETVLTSLMFIFLPIKFLFSLICLLVLYLFNIRFLLFMKEKLERPTIALFGLIWVRDIICVFSVISGIFLIGKRLVYEAFKKG